MFYCSVEMRYLLVIVYKVLKELTFYLSVEVSTIHTKMVLYFNNVQYEKVKAFGFPVVNVSLGGRCFIGNNFTIRGYARYTDTGENRPSKILVGKKGELRIGNKVGMSSCTIVCHERICIGNNVLLGGGVVIFDTNFHSTDARIRNTERDFMNTYTKPVSIADNVFIGTASIITKGVSIGRNSIIAAGSVVVKSVPENEIWGGNPACFIKKINNTNEESVLFKANF